MTPDSSSGAVREEMEKTLCSTGFAAAERMSRFLRYVVQPHLDGQADKLKESVLCVEAFGRKPTYDPRIDAVVRTEAVKLRPAEQYYDSDGREDPSMIDLPKGGYVPVFLRREESLEAPPELILKAPRTKAWNAYAWIGWKSALAATFIALVVAITAYASMQDSSRALHAAAPQTRTIAVLPFEDLSSGHDQEPFCDGLTEEVIDLLTKAAWYRVAARTSSFAFKDAGEDIREIGKKLNVGYVRAACE